MTKSDSLWKVQKSGNMNELTMWWLPFKTLNDALNVQMPDLDAFLSGKLQLNRSQADELWKKAVSRFRYFLAAQYEDPVTFKPADKLLNWLAFDKWWKKFQDDNAKALKELKKPKKESDDGEAVPQGSKRENSSAVNSVPVPRAVRNAGKAKRATA